MIGYGSEEELRNAGADYLAYSVKAIGDIVIRIAENDQSLT